MADINVERKGPSIWPWIIGLIVLALLIWAIAEMVDTEEPAVAEVEPVEQVEQPPAAVPAPMPAPETAAAPLSRLMPLGPEDVGQPVLLEGKVVGTPTPAGFWVESADVDNEVIFVQSPARTRAGQMTSSADVQSGSDVEIVGTVQQVPPDRAAQWIDQAALRSSTGFADWTVHQDLMVGSAQGMQAPPAAPGQQPGTQPAQPGMQPTRPGDTVQGRY